VVTILFSLSKERENPSLYKSESSQRASTFLTLPSIALRGALKVLVILILILILILSFSFSFSFILSLFFGGHPVEADQSEES
jgi:hypothetical protein